MGDDQSPKGALYDFDHWCKVRRHRQSTYSFLGYILSNILYLFVWCFISFESIPSCMDTH